MTRSRRRLLVLVAVSAVAVLLPALPSSGQGMERVPPGTWHGSFLPDREIAEGQVLGGGGFTVDVNSTGVVDGLLSFFAVWNGESFIGPDKAEANISYSAVDWTLTGDGVLGANALEFEAAGPLETEGTMTVTQDGESRVIPVKGPQPESMQIIFEYVTCTEMTGTFSTDNFGLGGAPEGGPALFGTVHALPAPTDEVEFDLQNVFETQAQIDEAFVSGDTDAMLAGLRGIVSLLQNLVNDVEANQLCRRPQSSAFNPQGPFFSFAAAIARSIIDEFTKYLPQLSTSDLIAVGWLAAGVGAFNGTVPLDGVPTARESHRQLSDMYDQRMGELLESGNQAEAQQLDKAACQLAVGSVCGRAG